MPGDTIIVEFQVRSRACTAALELPPMEEAAEMRGPRSCKSLNMNPVGSSYLTASATP